LDGVDIRIMIKDSWFWRRLHYNCSKFGKLLGRNITQNHPILIQSLYWCAGLQLFLTINFCPLTFNLIFNLITICKYYCSIIFSYVLNLFNYIKKIIELFWFAEMSVIVDMDHWHKRIIFIKNPHLVFWV
jgi:hypothetical protein